MSARFLYEHWEDFRRRWGIQTPDAGRWIVDLAQDPTEFPPLSRAYQSCIPANASSTELSGDSAFKLLTALITSIENEMAKILKRHTKLFWFESCRSIGHEFFFRPNLPARFLSLFAAWCTYVSLAASLKYGRTGMSDVLDTGRGLLVRRSPLDFFAFGVLVIEFQKLQQHRIAVGNGATIQLRRGDLQLVREDQEETAGALYNKRAFEHSSAMFGPIGISASNEMPWSDGYLDMVDSSPTIRACLSAIPDAEENLPSFRVLDTWFADVRYLGFAINLMPLLNHLKLLEDEVQNSLRLSPEELISGLWAVEMMVINWLLASPWRRSQFAQDGWITFVPHRAEAEVRRRFAECFHRLTGKAYLGDVDVTWRRLFALLSLAERDCNTIDVALAEPAACLYQFGNKLVYDAVSVPRALHHLVMRVEMTSASRNIKSTAFEDEVRTLLKLELGDSIAFPYSTRKKFKSDGRVVAELDVAVQKQDILFLVECKAFSYTRDLLVGRPRAVRNRWSYAEDWIHQADMKARVLVGLPAEQSQLPADISLVVPVVCTPWVEMIHDLSEKYMLDDSTPRICTVTELAKFIESTESSALSTKCWIVPVR